MQVRRRAEGGLHAYQTLHTAKNSPWGARHLISRHLAGTYVKDAANHYSSRTAVVRECTWKLGVEELWASAPAALPAKSDSDMECWLPRRSFSLSLLLLFADFEVPGQCRNIYRTEYLTWQNLWCPRILRIML